VIATAVLVAVVAACGARAPIQPGPTWVIGFLVSGEGPDAATGDDAIRGARLAIDLVNKSYPDVPLPLADGEGLRGGVTLRLVTADAKGHATEAPTRMDELVSKDGAVAVIAADSADAVAAAGSEAQRLSVPLLDATSTADYLTELGLDWYFRTGPTDRVMTEMAFALLQRHLGSSRRANVAILAEPGSRGAAGRVRVRELADRAGYAVVAQVDLARTPGGRAEQAAVLSKTACDAVLAVAGDRDAVSDISDLTTRLTRPAPLVGIGPAFEAFRAGDLVGSGPAVLRTASWSAEFARRSPAARPVADMYSRRYGDPMTSDAATGFTAALALAEAIDAAGSAQPAAIRAALRKMSAPATQLIVPWNGIRFDANGQNQLAAAVIEGLDGSRFRVTYPPELAVGASIWSGGSS
jgi:branched-chain amino acid transport system substrate-binding protein